MRPHIKTHKMAEIVRLAESLGDPQAQVRNHRRGRDGGGGRCNRRAAGVSAHRSQPEAVRPPGARIPHDDLSRDGRSSRLGAALCRPPPTGLVAPIPVLVDLEIGMGRTGIQPGEAAAELYTLIDELPNLVADGLHAYDGHIHDTDLPTRRHNAQTGLASTIALRDRLLKQGLSVPRLVVGGTPTFPIHAELDLPGVECSPGTPVLYDNSYSDAVSRPAIHAGRLAAHAGGQPSGPTAGFVSIWVTRRSPPTPSVPAHCCSSSTMPGRWYTARNTW